MDIQYIIRNGKNGCDIPFREIDSISEAVKRYYYFSAPGFWMWKMFQIGFAYGKRAERDRRKKPAQK